MAILNPQLLQVYRTFFLHYAGTGMSFVTYYRVPLAPIASVALLVLAGTLAICVAFQAITAVGLPLSGLAVAGALFALASSISKERPETL